MYIYGEIYVIKLRLYSSYEQFKRTNMREKVFIISIVIAVLFLGCDNTQDKKVELTPKEEINPIKINPLEELEQVDKLLSDIAEKPQKYTSPSNKKSTVKGLKGTIIYVDPEHLETIDGSPLGDKIHIELLEMTDNSSMILNNTQTVSNGQVLVTGGAYYLNMTSNEKQLRIKSGKGLSVEFPKLTENEMELFLGERDSLGQINWIPTNESFESRNNLDAVETKSSIKKKSGETYGCSFLLSIPPTQNYNLLWKDEDLGDMMKKNYSPSSELIKYLTNNTQHYIAFRFDLDTLNRRIINVKPHPLNPTNLDSKEIIKTISSLPKFDYKTRKNPDIAYSENHYELQIHLSNELKLIQAKAVNKEILKQISYQLDTYKAVEVLNFGWINCDRFYNDPNPKIDIQILVNNDSLTGARIFAIFKDINSIMTEQYWKGRNYSPKFRNVPIGKELQVIALSAKDGKPYIFETIINTETDKEIQVDFTATTQKDIKEKLEKLN